MLVAEEPMPNCNLVDAIPGASDNEIFEDLIVGKGVRVERIVSFGHASPDGYWYDQDQAELVIVLSGRAKLTIEGHEQDYDLRAGDTHFLPAHCRHRVAWTDPDRPTVWLAVFLDADLAPKPAGPLLAAT